MSSQKIDVHTHILPPGWEDLNLKYGVNKFLKFEKIDACSANLVDPEGKVFRKIDSNCWDPEIRLKECEATGVNVQVLSTMPVFFSYWATPHIGQSVSLFLNDHLASVVQAHPKKFVGLGTVPMQDPKLAIKELERCVVKLGFAGVQIGSNINGRNLGEREFLEFYQAASEIGASVFVHPWEMLGKDRMQKFWFPWLVGMPSETALAIASMAFAGVFEKVQGLKICFAHGGGSFPYILGRLSHGFKVRPDLCATETHTPPEQAVGKFYVDSLVHNEEALHFLLKTLGAGSIVLGSDYPFPLGEDIPGKCIEELSNVSADIRTRLLYRNALEWLGRKESDFGFAKI